MKPTMTVSQLANRLDAINAEMIRRQDDNLRAWSQTQLRPSQREVWEVLAQDLCQLGLLMDSYYHLVDAFWGPEGPPPGGRPVLLRDPRLLVAFHELESYQEHLKQGHFCRERTLRVQRQAWRFQVDFPEAHQRFLNQLRSMFQNPVST